MTPPHDTERDRPRKRFDALSLFLAASMITLLAMYALDTYRVEQLTTHATRAAQLDLGVLKGPCTAMATGADGHAALIVCTDRTRAQTRLALGQFWEASPPPAWLDEVSLRDDSGTLVCPRTLLDCADHALPSRDQMKASRRRPARE